ncbi:MAG: LamG domain-containing protein [Actinomycetota bacterium]|nr:LamG domain-containing protein [Actinomycetota bacterium]
MPSSTSFSYDNLIAALSAWLEETSQEFIDNQSIIVSMGESRLTTDLNFEIFDRVISGALTPDQFVQAIKPSNWQGTRSLHLAGLGGSGDSDFANVVLLLHLDGVDGSVVTVDSSPSAHAMVFADDAEITTDQSKFGGASLGVNNSTLPDLLDDSLFTTIVDSDFDFGSGDWTIEFQYRADSSTGANAMFVIGNSLGGTESVQIVLSNGNIGLEMNGTSVINVFTVPHVNDTFHHLVVQRTGNVFECYLDGVESSSGDFVNSVVLNTPVGDVIIGGSGDGATPGQPFNGYIDEVRVTKGVARHTGNFTAPTQEFPNTASDGPRIYLERRTYEWCLDFEPDETAVAQPKYYAEFTETEFFMVPPPDIAYGFDLRQIQTPDALAPGNQNTWLGDNAGDLLLYACLLASDEFLISDQQDLETWRQSYAELMPARKIELRRQWRGDYDPIKHAAETVSVSG